MKKKDGQIFIDKESLYFDLKSIIEEKNIYKATVLSSHDIEDCLILRYLKEMGIALTNYDFSAVTYNKSVAEELIKIVNFTDSNIIIAYGGAELINTAKYAKAFLDPQHTPLLAVPAFVEAGDEANGRITFFNDEGVWAVEDDQSIPEYVFYDSEAVRAESKYDINTRFARGFCQAINIMWANKLGSPAAVTAAEGLKKLLFNATKIMRNEKGALVDSLEAACLVGSAVRFAEKKSLDEAAMLLSSSTGIHLGQAMMKMAAPICDAVENALISYGMQNITEEHYESIDPDTVTDEHEKLYLKLRSISDIVAPGKFNIHSLSYQVKFLERALQLFSDDLETDEALEMANGIDRNVLRDMPVELSDEDIRNLYLHVFHKETLQEAIDRYNFQISIGRRAERNARRIEKLKEQYADDLSEDRIITDPYFERQMARREMVTGLQQDVLETLLLSKELLEKYGLRYYLSEGTLLGAVRHKGFIPWDDDVDIMMPREDYNKLVELDKKGLIPEELHLDALENNPKHWVLGAKLQLTRQSKYMQSKVTGLSEYNGPYIDVFPLDYWNSPYNKKQYRSQRIVKMCRRMLFMKTGYSRRLKGKLHRYLMLIILPFVPNTAIEKLAIKHMTRFNNGNRKFMVHLCSYYRFYKEVFPTGFYGEPVYKEFEGHMFPVPKEYDFMLRSIYGPNYDTLPPARVAALRNHPFEVIEEDTEEDTGEAED